MPKKIAVHNLGCKVNSYELDVMQQRLTDKGYEIVPFDTEADVYIINTCTVTNIADRKSRQMLHKAKKENPEAIVVAVGCYVETDKAGVLKDESIDLAVGNNRKADIVDLLEEYIKEKESEEKVDKTLCGNSMVDINHTNEYEEMKLSQMPGHTRSYIKIQDGCNQFCSYCIIPFARGRIRSRQQQDIIEEVTTLAKDGCKEIVITGIHISSFGLDREGSELLELIQKLNAIPGIERIRLSSMEPRIITKEMAEGLAALPKVCPHFHLSLQSGCDETLKRMNRHYDTADFARGVELLRTVYDRPAITTDVIVGFPGETEEEFKETVEFLEKINFYEMHVFKYSVRKGTVAAKLPGQLTDKQKSVRSDVLLEMTERQSREYRQSFIGESFAVLWEDEEEVDGKTYLTGLSDRYVRVAVLKEKAKENNYTTGSISVVTPSAILKPDTLLI